MNDNKSARVLCPFYISHNKGIGNNITITCERIKTNMGFNVHNKLSFINGKQRDDFMEIFCMDRYTSCPYYDVIYQNKYKDC